MQKDFITATPDSGGSGSTTVTATAPANQTESARSTSLSVAGGGMTRTVGASQAAGVVTWNYYFSVTPTSLSFVAGGETKSVTVTSYRKKVINGVETSTQENVNYTVSVTGTGFSGSGTTVTAAANSATSTRTGTATYTQATSGKTQAVSLSQAAVVIPTYEISFTSDVAFENAFLFNTANKPSAAPGNFNALSSQGLNIDPVEWTGSLQVNDAARPGSFVNIYPRGKFYVRTQVSSGWTMSGVYTFTLQNSDQVCHLGDIM